MSVVVSDDENSEDSFSDLSQFSIPREYHSRDDSKSNCFKLYERHKSTNVAKNLINRQIYGRFTKNPRAKTERIFNTVHHNCRFGLSSLLKDYETMNHVFMGFTLCGQYFLSFTERPLESVNQVAPSLFFNGCYEYELYLWRFIPGEKLKYVSKHTIFKHLRGMGVLDKIMFMQFPMDPHKVLCYGLAGTSPAMVYITIITLPFPKSCKHCHRNLPRNESVSQGWCVKHGFVLHYMFSMSQPCPSFDPHISLAYPDHLVINTGHHIHILNVTTLDPPQSSVNLSNFVKDDDSKLIPQSVSNFNDTFSEVSESPSEHFGTNSVVDAILEDFNTEYDLEGNECNKPFHELNISCEPLNVTGKSYHNTLVQNIVDPRFKRLQNTSKDYLFSVPQSSGVQKSAEKNKIDKKIAEKAYEFIEENEKCEKLSSFRKKRLAEKKYEFSEDNSENIVPFNSLRRERRYLHRSRCIRSPDFNTLFLSPHSPMQSPNSRNGQFSPGGARNLYCPSIRNSPHHSKSPISPRESARKLYVYSPSLDSDCSDSDSRLILRMPGVFSAQVDRFSQQSGLLIVDPKTEAPRWIKKVVRRYSNGDFENSSLLSGQSRDDYNIPIEIPLLVHTLTDQHLDVVPDFKVDQVTEMQLIVTQRTFDCEQFVQRRAQKLCSDSLLEFLHCQDYDIKLNYICPLDGHIVCQAVIKMGTLKTVEPYYGKPENYTTHCWFIWNIATDSFEVIEPPDDIKLQPTEKYQELPHVDFPSTHCNGVLVMDYCYSKTKTSLRDYNNYYEICLRSDSISLRSSDDSFSFSD
ncbi:uncharacterized protein LOC100141521 [Tribolium castaneum]|uniref:DDB1- and CUL4-associated factor 15 WD40 repeat-containing domain-containing protein n=1 Tax=Tribolium castaneum TaxID=7070 RepID=D6X374_TRICA|nr:PREDICTED: uncharacterized protein LOC100141521 [Tribolium castaneum]EFA10338.2 hypothetical protein TcasGA2_TC012556 [Tribolium castaneum]|eukprot:XP_008198009.2 PREDICTED: uncharacterized protein LOC100141521 [Tribolium castaneum]